MSRRGGRNSGGNNWSTSSTTKTPRPKGLKGRDIGLFYKNQQKRQGKQVQQRDTIINFTIPPLVIYGLELSIKSIKKLADEMKIPILQTPFLNLNIKKEKTDEECDLSSIAGCSGSSSKTSSPTHEQTKAKDSADVRSCVSKSDIAALIKKVKEEPMDLNESIKSESDQSQENITMEEETSSNKRLLSLRGAGDFKYGYEDIITGTFDEKLEECLSAGGLITKENSEVKTMNFKLSCEHQVMLKEPNYKKFMKFRKTLPTYKKSEELLDIITKNQVVVISGETGCGKSTQVPQIILDDAIANERGANVRILVTQPRRIAASSLATRVAQERADVLGNSVGYAVRLEKVEARPRGSIMFCTTGILLSTLEVDQCLSKYSHVILDEVHERDCDIDLAMFVLKKVLRKRKDLKLILMSATIDAETLSEYFNNCTMMHIEGLAYPVKDVYLEEILETTHYKLPFEDRSNNHKKPHHFRFHNKKMGAEMEKDIKYKAEVAPWLESVKKQLSHDVYKTLQDYRIENLNIDLILTLLRHICSGPPGAILIFLPGIMDISKLLRAMEDSNCFPSSMYEIHPLHSKLPSLQQHKIFDRPPGNMRKIIVATNIAETSITIDDIVYVIDCGKMKCTGLNIEENISTLQTEWVSQANLRQRRGRAGRCQPGICYHLLTSYRASKIDERLLPELQRNPLLEPVLAIKRLRLGKAADALQQMPGPPAETTVNSAVKHLQQCGALDFAEKLTPLGWHLARLPVHPAAGKLLILGALFGCIDRASSIAAVWGFKDPFHMVIGKEDEVDTVRRNFALGEGSDHVAISEAIIQWESQPSRPQRRDFAYQNFLAYNTLELLSDMKIQLGNNLKQMGFLPSGDVCTQWENRNAYNLSLFKAIIAASLYPNIATTKWSNLFTRNPHKVPRVKARSEGRLVHLHPSSVLTSKRTKRGRMLAPACQSYGANWLVYWQKQRSSDLFLHEVTLVHTLPLLFFGELSVHEGPKDNECYISIGTVKVCCEKETAELLFTMRSLLDQVLASKIGVTSTHSIIDNPFENEVLNAVIELITAEDGHANYLDEEDDDEDSSDELFMKTSWR